MQLRLEKKPQIDTSPSYANVLVTPPINESYWLYRVVVAEGQAVVGFPKFGTIGIGFQVEEDWNTNLPYLTPAEEILEHIRHNKGSELIPDEGCLEAIKMIQAAAAAGKGSEW